MPGASFGRCAVVDTPVIRYDGWVLGCCNENVVTGAGPKAFVGGADQHDDMTMILLKVEQSFMPAAV